MIEIFRLENSRGLGIFQCHEVGKEQSPKYHTDRVFPLMEEVILRLSLERQYLFACQSTKHLADYFTLDVIEKLLACGCSLFKITIPEEFVLFDLNQCAFDDNEMISKESVSYDDFVEMVNNENCVIV